MARDAPDSREYVRVDVHLPTNQKLAELDDPVQGGWLYVTGVCTAGAALSDGVISPRAVVRTAGVPAEVGKWLIAAGLWHEPGHTCRKCPQPPEGRVYIHDYLRHQRSRAAADAAKRAGRQAAQARWGKADGMRSAYGEDADRMPTAMGDACETDADLMRSPCGLDAEAEAEAEVPNPSLLTFVGRLAKSDAREDARPPTEVIASWQRIAGHGIDLEAEAAAYLAKNGMRPAHDESAAWVGWLKQAHRHAARTAGTKPLGCRTCLSGWLPDEYGYASAIPCPKCKPHTDPRGAV
jgi:hypothetical protein